MSSLRQSLRCTIPRTRLSISNGRIRCGKGFVSRNQQSRPHSSDQSSGFSPASSSSVSQNEVSHFTKLASSWWDPHGPSRLLHLMNPLRHEFITSCLEPASAGTTNKAYNYLDIGCGGGIFATSAARLPHTQTVTAIDPTPSVIAVAKAKQRTDPALASPKLTYLNCAIEELSSNTETTRTTKHGDSQSLNKEQDRNPTEDPATSQYDIITLFEVLEHISQPATFLSTALTHLRPTGWLIGSTIARHPLSYLTTKLIAEAPILGVVPAGTHDWNQYINPGELSGYFEKENTQARSRGEPDIWSDTRVQGVMYIPVLGWKLVDGSEGYGNYFFAVQKLR